MSIMTPQILEFVDSLKKILRRNIFHANKISPKRKQFLGEVTFQKKRGKTLNINFDDFYYFLCMIKNESSTNIFFFRNDFTNNFPMAIYAAAL